MRILIAGGAGYFGSGNEESTEGISGIFSWHEFSKTIWETLQLKTHLYPTSIKGLNAPVKRPLYSVKENKQLNDINCNIVKDCKQSLIHFLTESFK
jgi:dTDP-4-dehydrorhamnose reductase